MSIDFSKVTGIRTSRGLVTRIEIDGKVAWNGVACRYVSLGDSIAAGQGAGETRYYQYPDCLDYQYGGKGRLNTMILDGRRLCLTIFPPLRRITPTVTSTLFTLS